MERVDVSARPQSGGLASEVVDAEAADPPRPAPTTSKAGRVLLGSSLVLVALNLRALFSSLAAVMPEVRQSTGATPAVASLLTTAPVLALGLFGAAYRRVLIRKLEERGSAARGPFWWLVTAELAFMGVASGVAAALAVRLALLKELSEVNLAFFDEPTTNMDEERRRNLAQQIGRIKDFQQLFVISHDDTFEGFTDQVILLGERN